MYKKYFKKIIEFIKNNYIRLIFLAFFLICLTYLLTKNLINIFYIFKINFLAISLLGISFCVVFILSIIRSFLKKDNIFVKEIRLGEILSVCSIAIAILFFTFQNAIDFEREQNRLKERQREEKVKNDIIKNELIVARNINCDLAKNIMAQDTTENFITSYYLTEVYKNNLGTLIGNVNNNEDVIFLLMGLNISNEHLKMIKDLDLGINFIEKKENFLLAQNTFKTRQGDLKKIAETILKILKCSELNN